MRIFISHSTKDTSVALAVIDLLRGALPLQVADIRCTSVDGHRLPGGASILETLRREVADAELMIGIISAASLASTYVTFELGARWGACKPLLPLLAPGFDVSTLKDPLAQLNARRADDHASLHEFVSDVSRELHLPPGSPAAYHRLIDKLVASGRDAGSPTTSRSQAVNGTGVASGAGATSGAGRVPEDVRQQIKDKAAKDYPSDFSTQKYVVKQQIDAWANLQALAPPGVPAGVLDSMMHEAERNYAKEGLKNR